MAVFKSFMVVKVWCITLTLQKFLYFLSASTFFSVRLSMAKPSIILLISNVMILTNFVNFEYFYINYFWAIQGTLHMLSTMAVNVVIRS